MDKAEKYDIKEASNPGLTASARRNYSVNAESNIKGAKMHGKTHGGAKMYGKGPKMESDAQQKTNLIDDNPIASRASGGSWMSKHTKSRM
jgi:hypothetical protein